MHSKKPQGWNDTPPGREDTVHVVVRGVGDQEFQRNVQFTHAEWTLSLSLGDGSYSDGRGTTQMHWNRTMEVALIRPSGSFVDVESDQVAGHVGVKYLPLLLECLYSDVEAEEKEAEYAAIIAAAREV